MAAIAPDLARADEFRADRETFFDNAIRRWPELADIMADGRRVGPLRAFTKWYGYFRQSAGPGWVLVGDAGHFKDFTPGQGISDALRQARRLAHTIEHGLGTGGLDGALQRWWRWRDDDAHEMYWYAHRMGAPGAATPWTNCILRQVSSNAEATRTFLQILNHDVPPSRLYTPSLAMRATVRAVREQPSHAPATIKELISTAKQNIHQARRSRDAPPGIADIREPDGLHRRSTSRNPFSRHVSKAP
jgi:2-polyprenyl-6-methoxyphenol hydroxylase-like FAD-dependent oxidoreductase